MTDINNIAEEAKVLANMISIRNHLQMLATGASYGSMSRDKQKSLAKVVFNIDEQVADAALSIFNSAPADMTTAATKAIVEANNKKLDEERSVRVSDSDLQNMQQKPSQEEPVATKSIPVKTEVPEEQARGVFRRSSQ